MNRLNASSTHTAQYMKNKPEKFTRTSETFPSPAYGDFEFPPYSVSSAIQKIDFVGLVTKIVKGVNCINDETVE